MKKILSIMLCILCCFLFASCGYQIEGLNNYKHSNSSIEIDLYLPVKTFLTDYKYICGDYYMYETGLLFDKEKTDRSLMYLYYDEEIYVEAKKCMLENRLYSEKNCFTYNGYTFMQEYNDDKGIDPRFPGEDWGGQRVHFWMGGYHDERKLLIFMGIRTFPETEEEIALATNFQIDKFLDYYFDDWFDFDR